MLVVGVGVFSILIVLLAIGAFDQWHIQSDGQITLVLSVPIFIVAVGLVLIIIGLVKGFSARK